MKKTSTRDEEDIKRRWVVNISERELEENEISLLRKGLNFLITPRHIPTKEILASIESAIHHLPHERQDIIRSEVHSVLRQGKPPKERNLTRAEQEALRELKTDESISIVKANKGNCTVVMNKID